MAEGAQQTGNDKTAVRPFHVNVPEAELAPRSWTERAYHHLIYFNEVDKGGHFAAWEQPQLFSEEVRAGFRPLRK
jgi:pimeloyl-ACP methyl ester carboxylesterase